MHICYLFFVVVFVLVLLFFQELSQFLIEISQHPRPPTPPVLVLSVVEEKETPTQSSPPPFQFDVRHIDV